MNDSSNKLLWLKKRAVLLLLLVAYVLSSSLILEQQRTIESQRILIRDLFHDSMELSQLKMKQATLKH